MPNIENSGAVSFIRKVRPNSMTTRKISARPSPIWRARLRLLRIAARHQDGDEDDVVDAEHDLEHRQGDESGPGVGIEKQFEHVRYLL